MILHARGEGLPFPPSFRGGLYFFPGIPAVEERADIPSRALRAVAVPAAPGGAAGGAKLPGGDAGSQRALEGAPSPAGQVEQPRRAPEHARGSLRAAGGAAGRESRDGAGQPDLWFWLAASTPALRNARDSRQEVL